MGNTQGNTDLLGLFFLFSCHFPKQALQLNPGIMPSSEKTEAYSYQSGKAFSRDSSDFWSFNSGPKALKVKTSACTSYFPQPGTEPST